MTYLLYNKLLIQTFRAQPGELLVSRTDASGLADFVPKVCDLRRGNGFREVEGHLLAVNSIEQADPASEDDGRQRDMEFVDEPRVEVLEDRVSSPGDSDVAPPDDLARFLQRTLNPVVDEVEGRPAWALPRSSDLVRHDEDRRVERRLLGPKFFPALEHSLAHDAHPGAIEGVLEDPVVLTLLSAFAELEILLEESLLEDPLLELHPLTQP